MISPVTAKEIEFLKFLESKVRNQNVSPVNSTWMYGSNNGNHSQILLDNGKRENS